MNANRPPTDRSLGSLFGEFQVNKSEHVPRGGGVAVWRGPHVGRLRYLGSRLVLYGEVLMWVGGGQERGVPYDL